MAKEDMTVHHYSRGYNDGRNAGSKQCLIDKRNNNVRQKRFYNAGSNSGGGRLGAW